MGEVKCPLSIQELDNPNISKEEYIKQIDQMVDFAFNDYCTLSSTRRINPPQYRKILETAYENKLEDLMDLFYK
jgi:alcohol dehydrogenase class IV